jgi:hypothetical protein
MHALVFAVALATTAFDELQRMCTRDAGATWGRSLCGPTLIVDPATRTFVARRADGTMFEGALPKSIGVANTAAEWEGTRWTMIMAPLPENAFVRRSLLAHESFHRIAPAVGFISAERSNAHLDTATGRWLLQLEWRALARALAGDGAAVRDALAFRARRRELFANAAADEQALEMNEGLAEYTGVAFAAPAIAERIPFLVAKLADAESTPTFVRSFAYATTPAWGTLLAMREPRWTRHIKPADDVAQLVAHATHVRLPTPLGAYIETASARYGGATLLASERAREERRQIALRTFTARFVDNPHLTIPLRKMSMEFNPDEAQPFPPHGTVYPTITVRDVWGSIVVHRGGAVMASDWSTLTVPAANDDYTLTLADGWKIDGGQVKQNRER